MGFSLLNKNFIIKVSGQVEKTKGIHSIFITYLAVNRLSV